MHTTRVTETACPKCGHKLDSATAVDGSSNGPVPGDLTICANCATPLQFDGNLTVIELTEEEMVHLPAMVKMDLLLAIKIVQRMISNRP